MEAIRKAAEDEGDGMARIRVNIVQDQSSGGIVTANQGNSGIQPWVTDTFINNWPATQPVSGPLTNTELRAVAVPVSGPVTDTQIRATPLPVSGTFYPATQPVSGTFWQTTQPVSGTFWQTTQPVSGPLTDTQLRATAVPVSGTFWQATQPTKESRPGTGTLTNVAGNAGSTSLIASNANRLGAVIYNDSTSYLNIKYGSGASATSFTYRIPPNYTWEMPHPGYTGDIYGIWDVATGNARCTEIT